MNADHQSYQRASRVSLLGLLFQVVFGVALLIYGLFSKDQSGVSAGVAVLVGIPVWVGLALVFHQHRLERLEALESEAFARSSAAASSVFEDTAGGEQVQGRKLAWMHRWFLPVLSLFVAAAQIGLGVYLFIEQQKHSLGEFWTAPPESGWGLAIGIGIAAIGFVFARFVAGMAKQSVWSLLHAGAAAAVGASLLSLLLFVAHFLGRAFGTDALLRWLPLAIDVFMVVLGVEILLNFVLNLYRPRRAGEWLRPAFDSRVLAFIAAPDRLAASISDAVNYQFGFDVSSTWFYRLVSRSLLGMLVLSAATLWLMTAFAVVGPDQRALVLRGGDVIREEGSGLVIKRPWPLDRLVRFPASSVNQFVVGSLSLGKAASENQGPILWSNASSEGDSYVIVRAGTGGSSLALLSMEAPVHYRVSNLEQYLELAQDGPSSDRERVRRDLLEAEASRSLVLTMARFTVEQLLGPDRPSAMKALSDSVQDSFDAINAGVEVVFVGLQGVQPAREVAESFETVGAADYKRDATVAQAEAAAIETLARVAGDVTMARGITAQLGELDRLKASGAAQDVILAKEREIVDLIVEAGGQAAVDIARARGDRWHRAMGERAKAALAAGQIESFRAAPHAYVMGLYMDALRDSMAQARVWITPFDDPQITLDQIEVSTEIPNLASEQDNVQE